MKLAISNIGWTDENDLAVYEMMISKGFTGLEIAPTRIFPDKPYEKIEEAAKWASDLNEKYGFKVPSMQSIWYGRSEMLFGSDDERKALVDYTKEAVDFAEAVKCGNLVFGCPRNRNMPEGADRDVAVAFFKEIGDYAAIHNTVIGMEANPPIYNTNFVNTTSDALDLISQVGSKGFKLNLDVGTMVYNNESVSVLAGKEFYINHVHISEPYLKPVEQRQLHKDLAALLADCGYQGYVSIEAGKQEDISVIGNMMNYVGGLFL